MIYENNPITNIFVSLPVDLTQFNCATFIAGIIAGILDSAKFVSPSPSPLYAHSNCSQDAKVTAHFLTQPDGSEITVFLIKFSPEVMARESRYGS